MRDTSQMTTIAIVDTFINLGLKPKDSKKKKKGSKPSDKKKHKKRSEKSLSPILERKIGKKRTITSSRVDDAPFRPATRTSKL